MGETTTEILARWWCTLNRFEFPADMPNKPKGWDTAPNFVKLSDRIEDSIPKTAYIRPLHNAIELIIGEKEVLRWNLINNMGKTNDEFESWWKERERKKSNV